MHVPTFRSLVGRQAPHLEVIDTVEETLLDEARQRGVDEVIRHRLQSHLICLRDRGASVVVCTCSTLGGAAEQLAGAVDAPVIRIDRPMAQRAAAIGGRIAVVATVESTLASTRELLAECLAASEHDATLIDASCLDAWPLFESGDISGYLDHIAGHVRRVATGADVIVLAQASMAPAVDQLAGLPVLCSPAIGVEAAVAIATDHPHR